MECEQRLPKKMGSFVRVQLDLRFDLEADCSLVVALDDTSAVVGSTDVVPSVRFRVHVGLVAVRVRDALQVTVGQYELREEERREGNVPSQPIPL
jgi:hypothetical protein